jgi:hypothetical protein
MRRTTSPSRWRRTSRRRWRRDCAGDAARLGCRSSIERTAARRSCGCVSSWRGHRRFARAGVLGIRVSRQAASAAGSCWGGRRCAPTPLRCSERGRAAEFAPFPALTALEHPRGVRSRSALHAPTPLLALQAAPGLAARPFARHEPSPGRLVSVLTFSSPHKSPSPDAACREDTAVACDENTSVARARNVRRSVGDKEDVQAGNCSPLPLPTLLRAHRRRDRSRTHAVSAKVRRGQSAARLARRRRGTQDAWRREQRAS